ncbi:MAG: cupin domain-containing protein [Candidatus Delongbacteria bacterium]|jgi:predicted cupin superfamily sugar epimerase|nr:cupin domain-containing protein [Candidatus Delongbacteria bacterium]
MQTPAFWKNRYGMEAHPEGGWFYETFSPSLKKTKRSLCTSMMYLLEENDYSAFHRIESDELWHYYDGSVNVLLHCLTPEGEYDLKELGVHNKQAVPCVLIPANTWFAAELAHKSGTFALSGCTVSPVFDFDDFEMAD